MSLIDLPGSIGRQLPDPVCLQLLRKPQQWWAELIAFMPPPPSTHTHTHTRTPHTHTRTHTHTDTHTHTHTHKNEEWDRLFGSPPKPQQSSPGASTTKPDTKGKQETSPDLRKGLRKKMLERDNPLSSSSDTSLLHTQTGWPAS